MIKKILRFVFQPNRKLKTIHRFDSIQESVFLEIFLKYVFSVRERVSGDNLPDIWEDKAKEIYKVLKFGNIFIDNDDSKILIKKCKQLIEKKYYPSVVESWIRVFNDFGYDILDYLYLVLSYTNLWFTSEQVFGTLLSIGNKKMIDNWIFLKKVLKTKHNVIRRDVAYFPFWMN